MESGTPHVSLPTADALLKTKTLLATNRIIAGNMAVLEDLQAEHTVAMAKLREKLPGTYKNYVDLADYFTDAKFEMLRNRILKTINDARREIEETIDNQRIDRK